MKLADLVFLLALLGVMVALVRLAVYAARRQWRDVRRLGMRLTGFTLAYLAVIVVVSLATPRRWVALGEEQRFDDWSLTILHVRGIDGHYELTMRVANRARRSAQRAADAAVLLVAADGRTFEPLPAPTERSLQSVLQPGESFDTVRRYDVPTNASIIGIDVVHGAWPEWFIVGDRGSLLHRRPLVRAARESG